MHNWSYGTVSNGFKTFPSLTPYSTGLLPPFKWHRSMSIQNLSGSTVLLCTMLLRVSTKFMLATVSLCHALCNYTVFGVPVAADDTVCSAEWNKSAVCNSVNDSPLPVWGRQHSSARISTMNQLTVIHRLHVQLVLVNDFVKVFIRSLYAQSCWLRHNLKGQQDGSKEQNIDYK